MSRWRALAALGLLQLALVGAYFAVEATRAPEPPFAFERLDEPAPALSLERGGQPLVLAEGESRVVHFWATWCEPCQAELPGLLAAAEAEEVELIAITEESWPEIEAWFGGEVPPAVARDPGGRALEEWRVSGLPDTFRVEGGRVTARVGGPRDWSGAEARGFLREVGR